MVFHKNSDQFDLWKDYDHKNVNAVGREKYFSKESKVIQNNI